MNLSNPRDEDVARDDEAWLDRDAHAHLRSVDEGSEEAFDNPQAGDIVMFADLVGELVGAKPDREGFGEDLHADAWPFGSSLTDSVTIELDFVAFERCFFPDALAQFEWKLEEPARL